MFYFSNSIANKRCLGKHAQLTFHPPQHYQSDANGFPNYPKHNYMAVFLKDSNSIEEINESN